MTITSVVHLLGNALDMGDLIVETALSAVVMMCQKKVAWFARLWSYDTWFGNFAGIVMLQAWTLLFHWNRQLHTTWWTSSQEYVKCAAELLCLFHFIHHWASYELSSTQNDYVPSETINIQWSTLLLLSALQLSVAGLVWFNDIVLPFLQHLHLKMAVSVSCFIVCVFPLHF